jgi:hypothetical protein
VGLAAPGIRVVYLPTGHAFRRRFEDIAALIEQGLARRVPARPAG